MEEQAVERTGVTAGSNQATPVAWQDLREWIALVEANGLLKRIDKPVDADEELAAIAYLATRREDAPALLFEEIAGMAAAPAARRRNRRREPSMAFPRLSSGCWDQNGGMQRCRVSSE